MQRYIIRHNNCQRGYTADRGHTRNQKEIYGRGDNPHCYCHDGCFFQIVWCENLFLLFVHLSFPIFRYLVFRKIKYQYLYYISNIFMETMVNFISRNYSGLAVWNCKPLCDKPNCLWYYKFDISENDFCGNESIFIFFYPYTSHDGDKYLQSWLLIFFHYYRYNKNM